MEVDHSEEEFVCPVCMMILVDPTTLNCGHSVCRSCLAGWYLSRIPRRRECPTCRGLWEGFPLVNTSVRNFIQRLHPEKIAKRRQDMEDDSSIKRNLDNFEQELGQGRPVSIRSALANASPGFYFLCGSVVAFLVALVMFFLIWGLGGDSPVRSKGDMPVATWKPPDVAEWLNYLGWARNYSENARANEIDGWELMTMETGKLMVILNVTDEYHRSALELAVNSLRESGVQMPQTIWEYKALYPGRSLFLSQAMKEAPRCTMLFLYFFYYEDCFLPFLHTTVPRTWDEKTLFSSRLPSPTWSQFLMFALMMLVFPYGMVGLFAWSLRSSHTVSHLVVLLSCFLQTVLELNFYSSCFLQGRWRLWRQILDSHVKNFLTVLVLMFVWLILPSIIATMCFYWNMYYTPVFLLKTFYQTFILHHN